MQDKLVLLKYKTPANRTNRSLSVSDEAWEIVNKLSVENNIPKTVLVDMMIKFASNYIDVKEVNCE